MVLKVFVFPCVDLFFYRQADVVLTLGTSLQILPCGNMPLLAKKRGGKFAIVSLQPTKHDRKCDLKINAYVDSVMEELCILLNVPLADWTEPTVCLKSVHTPRKEKDRPAIITDLVKCETDSKQNVETNTKVKDELMEDKKDSKLKDELFDIKDKSNSETVKCEVKKETVCTVERETEKCNTSHNKVDNTGISKTANMECVISSSMETENNGVIITPKLIVDDAESNISHNRKLTSTTHSGSQGNLVNLTGTKGKSTADCNTDICVPTKRIKTC